MVFYCGNIPDLSRMLEWTAAGLQWVAITARKTGEVLFFWGGGGGASFLNIVLSINRKYIYLPPHPGAIFTPPYTD